ncbi:hypothetical protein TthHB8_32380 (plasmid) [Thermus thermophilus]|nr:hypothetical protein JCM10941_19700 [Thermus thermophilus]BDE46552.1 hypothetical protein TthHB8_32380 [Thermus thermophilus]
MRRPSFRAASTTCGSEAGRDCWARTEAIAKATNHRIARRMAPTSLLGKAKFSEALFSLARFVAFLSLSFPAARAGPWSGGPAEGLRGQAEAAAAHPREPPSRVLA